MPMNDDQTQIGDARMALLGTISKSPEKVARAFKEMSLTKATFPVAVGRHGIALPFPDFLPLPTGSPINNATAKRIDEKLTPLQRLGGPRARA